MKETRRNPEGKQVHSNHNMTQRFKKLNHFLLNFYLYAICIYKSSKAISLRLRQTVRRSCVSVKSSLFIDQLACVMQACVNKTVKTGDMNTVTDEKWDHTTTTMSRVAGVIRSSPW